MNPPFRTKTLGTKVSEEEFAQLETAASERGLTLSEWCRETLLASVNGQGEKSAESGGTGQALMGGWPSQDLGAPFLRVFAQGWDSTDFPI